MRVIRVLPFLIGIALCSTARADQYLISTYAGVANRSANLTFFGFGVATDVDGNAYFTSNMYRVCVFKIDRNGVVTRIAGGPEPGSRATADRLLSRNSIVPAPSLPTARAICSLRTRATIVSAGFPPAGSPR
jgi:hypothetical protein